jgi:hypothetical protein
LPTRNELHRLPGSALGVCVDLTETVSLVRVSETVSFLTEADFLRLMSHIVLGNSAWGTFFSCPHQRGQTKPNLYNPPQ